jgi:hypothetical protein
MMSVKGRWLPPPFLESSPPKADPIRSNADITGLASDTFFLWLIRAEWCQPIALGRQECLPPSQ